MKKLFVASAAFLLGLAAAGPSAAQPYNYNLAGASAGGLWTTVGTGFDKAIRAAYPGSSITYQTSGGGFANVGLVSTGKADLAIVHDAELRLAVNGEEPFRTPYRNLRAIAVMYNFAPAQFVLTKAFSERYGVTTLEEIAQKKPPLRVVLNRRGNIVYDMTKVAFEASGIALDDIKKWGGEVILAASQEGSDLMRDRRADMSTNGVFIGNSAIVETGKAVPSIMVPLSEKTIKAVNDKLGTQSFTIKAGAYDWVPRDVPTVTLSALIVADEKFNEAAAYGLTKGLLAKLDEYRSIHKAMEAVTPAMLTSSQAVPYHPGALRAYREAKLVN
ncbi:MAG: TAXI family TRAP transporter solute-binding subunit [Alphaproteobacteria bacterium]|nr:TAXI family TRAP transporter solute-binding subunit [Alphaproteobacteria bacterium]